ncbi:MAG: flagellin lysine-N-methylase [Lachnospiraceae bacterium]|nr:flagellin lysine-N-methylase [Lachnospiraceae bacterium]
MRYSKPHYYDHFKCLAGKCPDTCCAGWQICIDEESLAQYKKRSSETAFGNRLFHSIDWEEGTFYQYAGRCAFLNEHDLCDLQAQLGETALCDTCRMYPRHVEEFDGLRELSLSLSCPEAARMILTCEEPLQLLQWETLEEEESFEDDEMDYLLFTRLEDAREVIISILQNRNLDIEERMKQVLELAEEMQRCMDENRDFDMDDVIEAGRSGILKARLSAEVSHAERYSDFCREFEVFRRMELLRPEWGRTLECVWDALYADGFEKYEKICRQFHDFCEASERNHIRRQEIGEQLMMFFVYTYFCGAVYDDEIAVKIRLAVFSVRWIQELVMYRYLENGERLSMDDVIELSWRYAREVEHSDMNLEILEEWLM